QPTLLADIQACLEKALDNDFAGVEHDEYVTEDSGHGRQERRSYTILIDPELATKDAWTKLRVVGMCHSECVRDGKPSTETRYFIGSRKASAKVYGRALRNHWGIENGLHWVLDVSFAEDKNRVSKRHGG